MGEQKVCGQHEFQSFTSKTVEGEDMAVAEVKIRPGGATLAQETWDNPNPIPTDVTSPQGEPPRSLEFIMESRFVQATPQYVQIGALLDDRLRLREPLTIEIEKEDDIFIAKCEYLEEFGYGASPTYAIADLQQTLSELYWSLKKIHRLGRNLEATKSRLDKVLQEV